MCNNLTMLAHLDQFRWISICEHNAIHLYWNNTVLFMHPNELNKVGWALDTKIVSQEKVTSSLYLHGHLGQDQTEEKFTLWVANQYAIVLKRVELLQFGSLVSQAIDALGPHIINGISDMSVRIEKRRVQEKNKFHTSRDVRFSKN